MGGAKIFWLRALAVLAVGVPVAAAQDVVSAMAGYVHFAEGEVMMDGKPLEFDPGKFVHSGTGQRLRTWEGRTEVMIMPGSFIRLGSNTELEMVRAGMLLAHMRLIEGSAAIDLRDAAETDGITVDLGELRVRFIRRGFYRLDISGGGNPVVRVSRGKARVEYRKAMVAVGGGRRLTVTAPEGKLRPEKFSRKDKDELDRWSEERRALLAAKAREQGREGQSGSGPLEESEVYRCRVLGRHCPTNLAPAHERTSWPWAPPFWRFSGEAP